MLKELTKSRATTSIKMILSFGKVFAGLRTSKQISVFLLHNTSKVDDMQFS